MLAIIVAVVVAVLVGVITYKVGFFYGQGHILSQVMPWVNKEQDHIYVRLPPWYKE